MGRKRTRISKKVNKLSVIYSKAMKITAETVLKRIAKKKEKILTLVCYLGSVKTRRKERVLCLSTNN